MPTPLELICDPMSLASFALFFALLSWERLVPARPLPQVSGWWLRGLFSFAAYFLVASYLPLLVGDALSPLRIVDLSSLGSWGGAVVAVLAYELLAYAYHRAIHASDTLFRICHQVHHSAERLDVLGAFWFGPGDLVGFTLMSMIALAAFGITAEATFIYAMTTLFLATFQHLNVRTPVWLGYFIQRPESHAHHHARGLHRDNYADFPFIDMLFGTFVNPREFAEQQGYYDGASTRVLEMMLCVDVTSPERASLLPMQRHSHP